VEITTLTVQVTYALRHPELRKSALMVCRRLGVSEQTRYRRMLKEEGNRRRTQLVAVLRSSETSWMVGPRRAAVEFAQVGLRASARQACRASGSLWTAYGQRSRA
jgi:hypothetical protein